MSLEIYLICWSTMKRLLPASALDGCFQKLVFPEMTHQLFI